MSRLVAVAEVMILSESMSESVTEVLKNLVSEVRTFHGSVSESEVMTLSMSVLESVSEVQKTLASVSVHL